MIVLFNRDRLPGFFSHVRYFLMVVDRAFHKLLQIFLNVSRNFFKKCPINNQKLLFVTKVTKRKSDAKICKLYNQSKISKHFCSILRRNQRC